MPEFVRKPSILVSVWTNVLKKSKKPQILIFSLTTSIIYIEGSVWKKSKKLWLSQYLFSKKQSDLCENVPEKNLLSIKLFKKHENQGFLKSFIDNRFFSGTFSHKFVLLNRRFFVRKHKKRFIDAQTTWNIFFSSFLWKKHENLP